ncbi:MAG: hypothetical protein IKJ39_00075 [Lachnospiraceae bacterium]|nr:hypothetical protein [Lachnospiraceae bacterium]
MTKEEAELWIRRLEGGNSDDAYRPSTNLSIVLRLMLHSGLKAVKIYRLTVGEYQQKTFPVREEDNRIIQDHIRKNQLEDTDLLIRVSDRALRYKFQNLVSVYHTRGRRPEMADFFFAGQGIEDNKPMKRTE